MRYSFFQLGLCLCAFGAMASFAQAATEVPLNVSEGSEKLLGALFLPEHPKGAIPLVVVAPEWWGRNDYSDMRARKVADQLGAAALSVDFYGNDKSVQTPTEATEISAPFYKNPEMGVRRLNAFIGQASAAAAASNVTIDTAKIIAIGYCFGGTQVLDLARSGQMPAGDTLVGVVTFHGGLSSSMHASGPITAKLLILHGAADQLVKPADVAAFKKEMKEDHAQMRFIAYPGAMHAFTNPQATEIGQKYHIPVAYNESADKKSWAEFKKFYKQVVTK